MGKTREVRSSESDPWSTVSSARGLTVSGRNASRIVHLTTQISAVTTWLANPVRLDPEFGFGVTICPNETRLLIGLEYLDRLYFDFFDRTILGPGWDGSNCLDRRKTGFICGFSESCVLAIQMGMGTQANEKLAAG